MHPPLAYHGTPEQAIVSLCRVRVPRSCGFRCIVVPLVPGEGERGTFLIVPLCGVKCLHVDSSAMFASVYQGQIKKHLYSRLRSHESPNRFPRRLPGRLARFRPMQAYGVDWMSSGVLRLVSLSCTRPQRSVARRNGFAGDKKASLGDRGLFP